MCPFSVGFSVFQLASVAIFGWLQRFALFVSAPSGAHVSVLFVSVLYVVVFVCVSVVCVREGERKRGPFSLFW